MAQPGGRRPYAGTEEAVAERRRQILHHTANLVSSSGVGGCTFAAVSEATGFSIGMIQHYFRTRARLIDATVEQRITEVSDEWSRIGGRTTGPLEKIRELITFTVEGDRSFHDAWGFWIELYVAARKEPSIARKLNDALEEWRRIFTEVLNEAIDGGHVTPAYDPDDLTRLLLAVVDGLAMQTINGSYGSDPAQMTSLLFRFAAGELNIPVREIEQAGDR